MNYVTLSLVCLSLILAQAGHDRVGGPLMFLAVALALAHFAFTIRAVLKESPFPRRR